MNLNKTQKARYSAIDCIKLLACCLVVLGHFYMSMMASGMLENRIAYNIIIQSIYSFHVPLFFICSGFLYQKKNKVHSVKGYEKNVLDKLLNLGVPYVVFTIITLLFKTAFADFVNNPASDFLKTIFISPVAPYWYLYSLFLLFIITPCVKSRKGAAILFASAVVLKAAYIIISYKQISLFYHLSTIMCWEIWFVFGMLLSFYDFSYIKKSKAFTALAAISLAAAVVLSVIYCRVDSIEETIKFALSVLYITAVLIIALKLESCRLSRVAAGFSEYFMPVYVMHTIFAAGIRILLLKLGTENIIIHSVLGIAASFIMPIIAYELAKRIPVLLFFIYPKKAISQIKRKKNEQHSR